MDRVLVLVSESAESDIAELKKNAITGALASLEYLHEQLEQAIAVLKANRDPDMFRAKLQ
jgi:hypothetical protein